jgi:hypothetical protein
MSGAEVKESGMIPCELLKLKEKISLLESYLAQFSLPEDAESAVSSAFEEILSAVDRVANVLTGECKNDRL